jgi:hypothetical protein
MSTSTAPRTSVLLEAPFTVAQGPSRLGRALWLYLDLVVHVTISGHAWRTQERLTQTLHADTPTIDRWLGRLVDAHLVTVIAPLPYLVVKLPFWPSSAVPNASRQPENSSSAVPAQEEVPVYGQSNIATAAFKLFGDRGPGEGGQALRTRLTAILGNDQDVDQALASVSAPVLLRALHRVEATPDHEIKKSRLALFRFLVAKYQRAHP